ncbi:MAG: site-specific DNA-methyltransferase [Nitrospirae bacterium]|nr:site-specific DNA-methyltransferase [Nitrospirota bacterium]
MKKVKSKEIMTNPDKPVNLLIEGDNYHALSVLNYTHAKKIDVIYIDPPYNTGAKDWKYNNAYVDENDAYRHSKWLSFMDKRLRLAKNLLKHNGVLICTIDENEHASLGLLLQKIFIDREIVCVTIIHNPGGIQGNNFSYCHEYSYFVYPSGGRYINLQERDENPDVRPLRNVSKGDHLRETAANCFYPIFVKNEKIIGFGDVCPDSYHPRSANILRKDGTIEIYPIDVQGNERKWVFARQSVESIIGELSVEYNKKRGIWDIIRKKTKFPYKTVWTDPKYNANLFGTQLLSKIIPTKFPFPKSLYAVEDCIQAVIHDKDNAVILDFFAGSGTTGHAILELNKRDDGNRQFILCTNNENNICTEVCYPRIEKVIKGYKNTKDEKVEGLGGNLKYFKTDFVAAEPTDKNKKKLTEQATEMLCIREGTFELFLEQKRFNIFKSNSHYTGIVFDQLAIPDFKKAIKDIKGKFSVYVFSLGDDTFDEEFEDLKQKVKLSPIPEAILRVYRRIFK